MEDITMKGNVETFLVSPDGERVPVQQGSNTVSYACADAVARLFAGRGGGPTRIAFVYAVGNNKIGSFLFTAGERNKKESDIVGSGLSVVEAPVDPSPSVSPSDDTGDYEGNKVELRATAYSSTAVYIYGYLLKDAAGNVLAVRKLASPIQKPKDYGLSVSWSITFL